MKISNPSTLHKPNGYSHVAEVTSGKLIYVAGQVAFNASGEIVGKDDFGAQAEQVFKNLDAALKAGGASFQNVIKMNIYVDARVERAKLPALRGVRDQFVEIEAIAVID
jgi:enamine deaminase RidA (YjgF/YER057c/UK114 family)